MLKEAYIYVCPTIKITEDTSTYIAVLPSKNSEDQIQLHKLIVDLFFKHEPSLPLSNPLYSFGQSLDIHSIGSPRFSLEPSPNGLDPFGYLGDVPRCHECSKR